MRAEYVYPWSRQGRSCCRSSELRKAQKYVRVTGAAAAVAAAAVDVHEWRSAEPPGSFMVSLERVGEKSKNTTCMCVCSKKRPNGDQKVALLWC